MKQLRSLLLSLLFAAAFIFATSSMNTTINASAASYSLSATYKCMYVGQTYTAKVSGSSSVKWSSSNSSVASVTSSGKITAKKVGSAYIYAKVGSKKLTLKIESVHSTAYKAANYANNAVGSRYSQANRMGNRSYDCGSLVWRSYSNSGYYIGGKSNWAPTAADSAKKLSNASKVISYSSVSSSKLLPGDIIYTSSRSNGRFRNITHAIIYVGNGKTVEAANSRTGVVKRNYSSKNIVLVTRPTAGMALPTVITKLSTPKITSLKASTSKVTVKWASVSNAKGYIVYRKIKGGTYKQIATVSSKTKSYTDKAVKSGCSYTYTVKAYNGSVRSDFQAVGYVKAK